jgi:hypothetical protein
VASVVAFRAQTVYLMGWRWRIVRMAGVYSPRIGHTTHTDSFRAVGSIGVFAEVTALQQWDVRITLFEAVEDGYLLAFAAGESVFSAAMKAVVALDPWQRRWLPAERAWWIADDAISLLARRLPAVAEALDRWRAQPFDFAAYVADLAERLAGGSGASSRRLRRPIYLPADVAIAYGKLRLAPGASAEEVRAARRSLARAHHPDAGGAHDAMVAINAAADTALRWLQRTGRDHTLQASTVG